MVSRSSSERSGVNAAVGIPTSARDHPITTIPHILPHERVFPIQIGGELFKLSGASLSSDAPSYFSQYFRCQIATAERNGEDVNTAIKTLYIDRDPVTFRDIALHLQGYHVSPRDGQHFVRLFADSQFYNLPKLISQLFDESIFISIGHREFQIPRDVFTEPGNSPNYFSLGFAAFFSRPEDLFPGLDREDLIRPPSILPPSVPNKSADTFADLLRLLRGYPVSVRDEEHRHDLLRDARYFHFKGLEQRLIPHHLGYNLSRGRNEITLRLENVQKSGVNISQDGGEYGSYVTYARPFVDDAPAELVLEIGQETTKIHNSPNGGSFRAEFFKDTRTRIAKLFEVIATKMNLPPTTQPLGLLMASGGAGSQPPTPGNTPLSEDFVRVAFEPESSVTLDGKSLQCPINIGGAEETMSIDSSPDDLAHNPKKRRRPCEDLGEEWVIATGQWRLRIQASKGGKSAVECVLVAVKVDAMSTELGRNTARGFLGN